MEFLTALPYFDVALTLLLAAHGLALAIVNMTDTPTDDDIVAFIYKIIEYVAGITGKAKQ
jgi:hypothetical protein